MRWGAGKMRCEETGTLRAFLDGELCEEDGVRTRRHLQTCARCRSKLEELKETATTVARALPLLGGLQPTEEDAARRAYAVLQARLEVQTSSSWNAHKITGRFTMVMKSLSSRYRLALAGMVSLLVLALIAMTPQGQVAAANFLAQFRAQKLKVVSVDPNEFSRVIRDLSHFGEVDMSQLDRMTPAPVGSVAEASERAKFTVKEPKALPAGGASEVGGGG